jgi:hypothetical protein
VKEVVLLYLFPKRRLAFPSFISDKEVALLYLFPKRRLAFPSFISDKEACSPFFILAAENLPPLLNSSSLP